MFDDVADPIGASGYLDPGTHTVRVALDDSAFAPGSAGSIAAVAHRDTGDDEAFTRYDVNTSDDPPYRLEGAVVDDTAVVRAPATITATTTTTATTATTPTTATTESVPTAASLTVPPELDTAGGGFGPYEVLALGIGLVCALGAVVVLAGGWRR